MNINHVGANTNPRPTLLAVVRVVAAWVAILVPAFLVGGCTQLPNQALGPLTIQVQDGSLRVAVCQAIYAREIYANSHGPDVVDNFWRARAPDAGGVAIGAGTILTTDSLDKYFLATTAAREPTVFHQYWGITVAVLDASDPKGNFVAAFDLRDRAVPSDSWLHPEGTVTSEPCEGVSSPRR